MQWNCGVWNTRVVEPRHTLRHIRSGAMHSLGGAQVFRLQGRDDNTDVLRTEQRLTGGKDAYVV